MPSPEGVGAGQTATFKLPIGKMYHELQLSYTGVTLAEMTEIRVMVNGKVIHRYSATERNTINMFDGRLTAGGILVIPFERYNLKTLVAERETALNTGSMNAQGVGITQLTVEIDLDAGIITSPVLSMNATQSTRKEGGAGTVLHCVKHSYSVAGAGNFEISDLPRGQQTSIALNRIFFIPSANDITEMKIERNQYNIFQRTKALNERIQRNGVRTPQVGVVAIDKSENGEGGNWIDLLGISDYRYHLEVTGACTIQILSENVGRLGD